MDGFIPTGSIPTGIVFSPDGSTAYVADQFADVSVIDVATRQVMGSIPVGNPLAVRVSPVVTLLTRKLAKSIDVGGEPRRIAFSQHGHIAAVTNATGFISFIR